MSGLLAGTIFDRPPHCELCELPEQECQCPPSAPQVPCLLAPQKQTARLTVEKRKRGKTVTVIRGLSAANNNLPGLLKTLKAHCGAGGSLQEESIEIQGRHVDRLRTELQRFGYRVNR